MASASTISAPMALSKLAMVDFPQAIPPVRPMIFICRSPFYTTYKTAFPVQCAFSQSLPLETSATSGTLRLTTPSMVRCKSALTA